MAIAKQVRPGMDVIRRLDDAQMDRLVEVLRAATTEKVSSPARLAGVVRTAEVGDGDDAGHVASALGPLHFTFFSSGKSAEEYSREVAEATVDQGDLPRAEIDSFAGRLRVLLSIDSVSSAFRAIALTQADQNVFLGSEVLLNMRPIFTDGVPKSAVLTYTLVVDYRSHEHREMHFALDESDIRDLRMVLERAEKKAATMRQWLETTSVSAIKV